MDKIIDPNSTYLEAILPWRDSKLGQAVLKKLGHKHNIRPEIVWSDLPDRYLETVINGDSELLKVPMGAGKYVSIRYEGIESILIDQYNKGVLTVDFQAMLDMSTCPDCDGTKLKKESLNVYLEIPGKKKDNRYNIATLHRMQLHELKEFLITYRTHTNKPELLISRIMRPLIHRVETINELGLHYITLARGVKTLSGGEMQRLRLAKQLGNKLTGIIYVLDEPTIGLDNHEIDKMLIAIRSLQKMGNTIIVVEHHDRFIEQSDRVVEIGPGAGDFGGHVIFNGPYEQFITSDALTAQYMRNEKQIHVEYSHEPSTKTLSIKKASAFNLQSIDVDIPLGSFTIITGPSGAGKTTLMYTTLYRFLHEKSKWIQSYIRLQLLKQGMSRQDIISAPVMKKELYSDMANKATQAFMNQEISVETIRGHEEINNVLYVDQSSIGKTPRSCPATFIGVFDDIRNLYAGTSEAKYMGFSSGHFSFNSKKGACPECK
jgi:excinuclease ABC subunit A